MKSYPRVHFTFVAYVKKFHSQRIVIISSRKTGEVTLQYKVSRWYHALMNYNTNTHDIYTVLLSYNSLHISVHYRLLVPFLTDAHNMKTVFAFFLITQGKFIHRLEITNMESSYSHLEFLLFCYPNCLFQ